MFINNSLKLIFLVNLVFCLKQNCKNPYIQELETKFQQYYFDYLRFGQAMLRARKIPLSDLNENSTLTSGQNCSTNEKNEKKQNGLCSSRVNLEYLSDRYPNYKLNVECDCRLCSTIKNRIIDPNYECQPVQKRVPILRKGKCASDGYYEWQPTIEVLNIGCACALNRIFIPF